MVWHLNVRGGGGGCHHYLFGVIGDIISFFFLGGGCHHYLFGVIGDIISFFFGGVSSLLFWCDRGYHQLFLGCIGGGGGSSIIVFINLCMYMTKHTENYVIISSMWTAALI